MTLHVHRLDGCAPRPLASYLKALAILRLVAEQKDPRARGYWEGERFHIVTALDCDALERFFLEEWRPTPMVSPWNKGSGFFTMATDKGLGPIVRSTAPRFAPLRDGVRAAAELIRAMDDAVQIEKQIKEESNQLPDADARTALRNDPTYKKRLAQAGRDCKRLKDDLQMVCLQRWRGGALRWLRAAVVQHAGAKPSFPSLLGTGGNDGKLDFTNNAYQRLGDLFDLESEHGTPRPPTYAALQATLWGTTALAKRKGPIGQFLPADAGGANATSGALSDSYLNPWDLPLLLEGAILFTSASTRHLALASGSQGSAPFAVRGQASGYASASAAEDAAKTGGEQWMPLWHRPWTLGELTSVLTEGRCQVNARSGDTAIDVARALSRLGVARGLAAFERYGYLIRNGKSRYAVPLGRWEVPDQPRGLHLDDLDQDDWWPRIRRAARDNHAPASFLRAERVLSDSILAALAHDGESEKWAEVLVALAEMEHQLVLSGTFTVSARLSPLPKLSPTWIDVAYGGQAEFRLALALAGAGVAQGGRWESVRAHWLPLARENPRRFNTREKRLASDPRVVVGGRDATTDLIAVVQRRLIEGTRALPLQAWRGTSVSPADLAAFVDGQVDVTRTLWLARALAAQDFPSLDDAQLPRRTHARVDLDPMHLALRLTHLAEAVEVHGTLLRIPVDPSVLRLLAAGEAPRAFEVIARRLHASGIVVPYRAATVAPDRARRLAASLAFPISTTTAKSFARSLEHPKDPEPAHVR